MSSQPTPDQSQEHESMALVLEHLVSSGPVHETGDQLLPGTSEHTAITPAPVSVQKHSTWWSRFFPGSLESTMDRLFASYHMGNYVAIRGQPGQKIFESMPIYVRVGMHLLFYKSKEQSFLRYKSVEDLLKTVSVRQGKVYDDESNPQAVLEHIQSFIKTYSINLDELQQPDPSQYPNFNSFFYRKLRPGARPIAEPKNASVVSSCADCRLTVFSDVAEATKYWIKGNGFTLNRLVGDTNLADRCFPPGSSIAIFRLAPADYHRFHHPVGPAVCGPTKHIAGEYFTVNPQAVNADFDVFSGNRRDVFVLNWTPKGEAGPSIPVAFVAIGAMLVGSIGWTNANQGSSVQRGDECGYYAYGGSTNIAIFPPEAKVQWDQDLLDNSKQGLETMVRVGDRIGISNA
ncbi:related to phosphatidylserine decarboxylase proenzyme 2 precursor [Sporisorium scitamineum]|uniref:Related to phosphatidylserine decarboxylase proenzyme 2 n=2 Tax=Sporisorium scitamineum TaxID=49012 RepID=A0A127ZCF6_9BASI|nr:related to phosphatidylserine decarboxylase proenzyme 2 precursor [Sporisorium scitamineum]